MIFEDHQYENLQFCISDGVLIFILDFGEESLYLDLSKDVERRLPQKSVHWNRYDFFLIHQSSRFPCLQLNLILKLKDFFLCNLFVANWGFCITLWVNYFICNC